MRAHELLCPRGRSSANLPSFPNWSCGDGVNVICRVMRRQSIGNFVEGVCNRVDTCIHIIQFYITPKLLYKTFIALIVILSKGSVTVPVNLLLLNFSRFSNQI